MTLSNLKNLFLVALLGATLVGCSSSPTNDDDSAANATKEASAVDSSNLADMSAEDILDQIQGKSIYFEFDRSAVQNSGTSLVKMNARYMALEESATVTLNGYADERGTPEYNLALSEKRANAVKDALVAEGVSSSRITTIGHGEAEGTGEASWSENRRVGFAY